MTKPELWLYQQVIVAEALRARECECEKTNKGKFCPHFQIAYHRLSELAEAGYYATSD